MTATEAQGHRWVRKDFDVHDGPKYKVQTLKLRRYISDENQFHVLILIFVVTMQGTGGRKRSRK